MNRILITGGAGNVGSALAARLLQDKNNYVVIADDLSTGSRNKLPSPVQDNWHFVNIDVNKRDELADVMHSHSFDFVFHYAATVGVRRTQENPMLVLQDIEGIKNILNISKNTGVKRVFYSSSSEIYGEPVELPQHEERTPLNSRIPYAVVKNLGECFCKSYHKEYGLNYTVFRFFNTYGPNQTRDFVISKFLASALRGEDITVYGSGLQTRTFCYVEDNVEACARCLYDGKYVNDVVNVGGAQVISIIDLARLVISRTGSSSRIVHLPPLAEGDMSRRQPDNSKMTRLLGRKLISLEEGIDRMVSSSVFLSQIGVECADLQELNFYPRKVA